MKEKWKDILGFPGYQVSDAGNVRSFWKKQKALGIRSGTERILCNEPQYLCKQSDDGNGYMKVNLQNDTKRRCVKVHRLVAEAFIPRESEDFDTVDHIISGREGKINNNVNNLRWISRRENIQKAYRDGVCDRRIDSQRKNILITDIWDNRKVYFRSIKEAADFLHRDYTTISHALETGNIVAGHYIVEHLNDEEKMLYDGGDFDAIYYNY